MDGWMDGWIDGKERKGEGESCILVSIYVGKEVEGRQWRQCIATDKDILRR